MRAEKKALKKKKKPRGADRPREEEEEKEWGDGDGGRRLWGNGTDVGRGCTHSPEDFVFLTHWRAICQPGAPHA